jgi:hypothetical protein
VEASRWVRSGEVEGEVPSSWIIVLFPRQVHLQKDVAAEGKVLVEGGIGSWEMGDGSWRAYKLRGRGRGRRGGIGG